MPNASNTFFIPTLKPFVGIVFFTVGLIILIFLQQPAAKILGIFSLIASAYVIITYAPPSLTVSKKSICFKNLIGLWSQPQTIAWADIDSLHLIESHHEFWDSAQESPSPPNHSGKKFQILEIILKSGKQDSIPLYLFQKDSVPIKRQNMSEKIVSLIQNFSAKKIIVLDADQVPPPPPPGNE